MGTRTLKRSSITLVLAVAMVAAYVLPAAAGDGPIGAVQCDVASANVGAMQSDDPKGTKKKDYDKNQQAGLYLVGTGPARTFTWHFQSGNPATPTVPGCTYVNTDLLGTPGTGGGELIANGLGTGWAGMSIGSTGKGQFTATSGPKDTEVVNLNQIWWVSSATVLFVRFKHNAFGEKDSFVNHETRGLGNGQAVVSAIPGQDGPRCQGTPGDPLDNKKDDDGKNGATCFGVTIVAELNASPDA